MARSKVEERRRKLRLDLLEVAWDPDGREIVQSEMDEIGLSRDSLFVEMRAAGWDQSHTTLGRWLRGQSEPSATELGLLTAVLAGYSAKGVFLSGLGFTDAIGLSESPPIAGLALVNS